MSALDTLTRKTNESLHFALVDRTHGVVSQRVAQAIHGAEAEMWPEKQAFSTPRMRESGYEKDVLICPHAGLELVYKCIFQ